MKKIFRVHNAQVLFNRMSKDSNCIEYGVDSNKKIYFHYANGITKRYTRSEFIKIAREFAKMYA